MKVQTVPFVLTYTFIAICYDRLGELMNSFKWAMNRI